MAAFRRQKEKVCALKPGRSGTQEPTDRSAQTVSFLRVWRLRPRKGQYPVKMVACKYRKLATRFRRTHGHLYAAAALDGTDHDGIGALLGRGAAGTSSTTFGPALSHTIQAL